MFREWKKVLAGLLAAALILTSAISSLTIQISGASILYGDVNGDGSVDMKDTLSLRRYIAGLIDDPFDKVAADVNGDGSIDMKDVLMTRKYIAQLIPELPGDASDVSDRSEPVSDASDVSDISDVSEQPSNEPISEQPISEEPVEPSKEPSTEPLPEGVIYDADVTGTLTLAPGATFESDAITAALQAYTAAHGIAERYIVTVTADATPQDYIYPILLGEGNAEVWPSNDYDHNYMIGQNGTTYGSLIGQEFIAADDAPTYLFFYAEEGNSTLTLKHIKIEAAGGSTPVEPSTTASTTRSTTASTSASTSASTTTSTTVSTTSTTQSTTSSTTVTTPTSTEPAGDGLVARWRANLGGVDGKPSYLYAKNETLQIIQYDYDAGYIVGREDTNVKWPEFLRSHGDLAADEYVIVTFENSDTFGLTAGTSTDAISMLQGFGYTGVTKESISQMTITANKIQIRLDGPQTVDSSNQPFKLNLSGCSLDKVDITDTTTMVGEIYRIGAGSPTTVPSTTQSTTSSSTSSTTSTTQTVPPSGDTVIYDADVTGTLTLKAGATFESDAITAPLEAENTQYGLAERYLITVQADASPSDYIYPILIGDGGMEAWPRNEYDHNYYIGQNGTITAVLTSTWTDKTGATTGFTVANQRPVFLYFYADGENATLTLRHIKIEVVRGGGTPPAPTSSTSKTTTTTTTTQTGPTGPTTTRTTIGTGDYTYIDGKPYISFRSYGDEGTFGTWWWHTEDVTNTTTCDNYLNFLYRHGVDEIYFYGYYWCKSNKTSLHSFVQKANAKGMAVSLIYDDADAITKSGSKEMNTIATNYLNYCSTYPSDRMAGIHFDVEGVSRDNMVTNMISQFAAARERGVYIAMDVNCKWTSSKTLNGVSGFMNIAAANLDCLSLMSYQDTAEGIWKLGSNSTANPFAAAKAYGCKVVFGVEVGYYDFNADSDAFYEEGAEVCYTELAKVYRKLIDDHPTGGYGIAVHAIRDWYTLKNK